MKRLVGFLGWIGVLLVVAAVILRFSRPDLLVWSQRTALAGLVVTLLYALTQWREIGRSLGGRNVKYGSFAVASVVLVAAILVGLNWVANRQNKRWDLTAAGQFSLSDQTKQVLAGLDQPLVIRAFYVNDVQPVRDRLNEYEYQSKQVSVEYIDADRDPVQAQKFGITTVPTLVLEYAGRTERATGTDEQTVTNALKKVVEGAAKKVYFVQGHGEHDPTASEPAGYSGIADALENDNFTVDTVTLAQQGAVPDDATVVVVAGPKTDLLAPEVDALRTFLRKGGKVQLLLDPPDKGTGPPLTNLMALAHEWGIDVGNDLIIDASGLGQLLGTNESIPVAMPVRHPITQGFNVMTAFPLARSVSVVSGGVEGRTAQAVLETSPQSWGESDIQGLYETGQVERNLDGGDKAGPLTIAAAVSAAAPDAPTPEAPADGSTPPPAPEARMVVVGDSDFASNQAIGIQGNREVYLNMLNWLAQQEDLIAIRPKSPEDRPITMTADQGRMVFWFAIAIVPLLLFGNAVRVYWRRR